MTGMTWDEGIRRNHAKKAPWAKGIIKCALPLVRETMILDTRSRKGSYADFIVKPRLK